MDSSRDGMVWYGMSMVETMVVITWVRVSVVLGFDGRHGC